MSLATLVVNLKANYGNLTSGLRVSANETAVAAQDISRSVMGIADGSTSFSELESHASTFATTLEFVAAAAEVVEHTVHSAAFAADAAAGAMARTGVAATTASAGLATFDKSVVLATGAVGTAVTVTSAAAPVFGWLARTLTVVASTFRLVAGLAGTVGASFSTVAVFVRGAANGLLHFLHMVHAARIAVSLLTEAFRLLMVPLRWIGSAAATVFRLMVVALNTVLLPVRLLWSAMVGLARVIWAVVQPIASVAFTVLKVWFIFKGWVGALRVFYDWLGMLPPKVRILVVGLLALGAAGKVGSAALRAFSVAAGVVSAAVRLAASGLQLLLLPILAIRSPMAALRSAANLLGRALIVTGGLAARAASGFYALAASVSSSVVSVVGAIGGRLVGAVRAGVTALLALSVAAAGFGVKLAAKAELSAVIFGTMLKSMSKGLALQRDLESWKGAPLFDPDQIQLSGTLLYKAGIAAGGIKDKLNQLGNIAAATKTPIEELARVYQQGMNQGAFQQDKINQLSDRGIAIYEGLAFATGKSGLALKKMISDGKIGPAQMNAAIEHLTTGTGIYAGAIDNVGKTSIGMWKTLVNKAGTAARQFGENLMSAFGFKDLMGRATGFFENLKTQLAAAQPAFTAWATGVKAAFSAVWEVATVVFSSITGALGLTGDNWMTSFLEWAAIATWAFNEWPDIATLAFVNVSLALVSFGNDFAHLFTGVMPALFAWFGDNWSQMFSTAASFVGSVFENIGKNIMAAMKAVWDYIASGGEKSLSVAWTPLLEGFQNTVAALPEIPPRAIGELEQQLAADSARLGESLGTSLADAIDTNMQMLADFEAAQAAYVPPKLGNEPGADPPPDAGTDTAKAKQADNKAADVRSAEGQQALANLLRGTLKDDDAKTTAVATKKAAGHLEEIARNSKAPKVRKASFARG
jgi:tape measure domain-containing protein